jgi:hypothetical protein
MLARKKRGSVQTVSVPQLQARLHATGAATIYVSDVPPGHADFAAVQWWGTAGGLHGLAPAPEKPGQRGKNIVGQYYEASPGHAAELDKPLDPALEARWHKLAGKSGLDFPPMERPPGGTITRGEWLRAAWGKRKGLPQ